MSPKIASAIYPNNLEIYPQIPPENPLMIPPKVFLRIFPGISAEVFRGIPIKTPAIISPGIFPEVSNRGSSRIS